MNTSHKACLTSHSLLSHMGLAHKKEAKLWYCVINKVLVLKYP